MSSYLSKIKVADKEYLLKDNEALHNVSLLSDVMDLTQDADGNFLNSDGTIADGVALAADVAKVITDNESLIAEALNDLLTKTKLEISYLADLKEVTKDSNNNYTLSGTTVSGLAWAADVAYELMSVEEVVANSLTQHDTDINNIKENYVKKTELEISYLSDLLDVTKDENNIYVDSSGTTISGLAWAADVAYEIIKDEKITSYAINQINDDINIIQSTYITNNSLDTLLTNSSYVSDLQLSTILTNSSYVSEYQEEITYTGLVTLASNSQLMPGKKYRITDFVTTVNSSHTSGYSDSTFYGNTSSLIYAKSAGHQFDLIVTATSNTDIALDAKAMLHSGDTYFQYCDLAKWKIKYTLLNNSNLYSWADSSSGKGVIIEMTDEYDNRCPYDFKNIQYYTPLSSGIYNASGTKQWTYTFDMTTSAGSSTHYDYTVYQADQNYISGYSLKCLWNKIPYFFSDTGKYVLNNIVMLSTSANNSRKNIKFGLNCYFDFIGNNSDWLTFGDGCYKIVMGTYCKQHIFNTNVCKITMGNNIWYANLGLGVNNITLTGSSSSSSKYQFNAIGDNSSYITIAGSYNQIGQNCGQASSTPISISGNGNIIGDLCNTITITGNYNRFGKYCDHIRINSNGEGNQFGDYCKYIYFITSSTSTYATYCKFNIIDSGNQYIYIKCTSTLSSAAQLRNIHMHQGVNNTTTYKTITCNTTQATYDINIVAAESITLTA